METRGKELVGDRYGTHRVISPKGALPQAAWKLDNDFSRVYDNEILCHVQILNIDAASFTDLKERAGGDLGKIEAMMLEIVHERGKHQNPRTGSGGMFTGVVKRIGASLASKTDLAQGDSIASLVSLTLTPLRIDRIIKIHPERDQVEIRGEAALFESGVWARLPEDIPQTLALAALDVAGAAAQVDRLAAPGMTVAVIGARGKSGLLCCYQAKKKVGPGGRVIAVVHSSKGMEDVANAPFVDEVVTAQADDPLDILRKIADVTDNQLCDLTISCVSRPDCEMGAILITRQGGRVYFFSMATSFTRAALGAEGVGKDVELIMGNGYCRGHAELTLDILRESEYIRDLYQARYG